MFHLTGQKRARSETKIHFRLQSVISFTIGQCLFPKRSPENICLPDAEQGGNRHRAVFFLGFRPSSLRHNPLIALSAGGTWCTVTSDRYIPSSTVDSRDNTVINRDPGETLWPINLARFGRQMSGFSPLNVTKKERVLLYPPESQRKGSSSWRKS